MLVKLGGLYGAIRIPLAVLTILLIAAHYKNEVERIIERLELEKTPEVFKRIWDQLRKRLSPSGIYGLFDEVKDHKEEVDELKQRVTSLTEELKGERDRN